MIGVMVRGNNGRPGNGSPSPCNWNMDWERPVHFSYLTKDGEMVFSQDANLEMCGGWSRAFFPHAFKLKGSKELGGDKNLPYPFFDEKPYIRNRTLQIRNGGNDNICRLKDPALQYIMQTSGVDLDVQSYQPVHEFVNGSYMGVLNVREPNNKHYVYANYGWDDDEIDQFEMSPDSGYVQKCGTADSYLELVDVLSANAANSISRWRWALSSWSWSVGSWMVLTSKTPSVRVPVLSNTTCFTLARVSTMLAPLMRMPLRLAPPIPAKKLRGILITRAQGQLMTRKVRAR